MPPKFLPSVPWNLGCKVPRGLQGIFVVFWGLSWLPKLPTGFQGVVPRCIENGGSDPFEAYRTHLAGYPPKLPPVMEEYCSFLQCNMLGTSGTCGMESRVAQDCGRDLNYVRGICSPSPNPLCRSGWL